MKLINELRSILNNIKPKIGFRVSYMLSGDNAIKQDLLLEVLKDAKNQADELVATTTTLKEHIYTVWEIE